ncbi:MAG: TIM barrel protein, partial [Planctomycetota bacterium]
MKPQPIRQSVMGWCFNPMKPITLARHAKAIGLEAIEGIGSEHYDAILKLGLKISLVGSHSFKEGPVNPDHHAKVESKLRDAIELAQRVGAPAVITFTGMQTSGISDRAAMKHCIACWKRIMPLAESCGVNVVLEHLNSVDDSHPMKGHPGYFGDD